jgi:hypothetical protein
MDGLSAASSAFAVVSLAIQIGGGIQKLCDFWTSIQDGPKDINSIIQDLQVVSDIVRDIRLEASNERPHSSALSASIAALNGCSSSMEASRVSLISCNQASLPRNRCLENGRHLELCGRAIGFENFRKLCAIQRLH